MQLLMKVNCPIAQTGSSFHIAQGDRQTHITDISGVNRRTPLKNFDEQAVVHVKQCCK